MVFGRKRQLIIWKKQSCTDSPIFRDNASLREHFSLVSTWSLYAHRTFYSCTLAKCPAGRPGTADEVANVAALLMSDAGAFITGSTFLIDGGATASYFYGPLKPKE